MSKKEVAKQETQLPSTEVDLEAYVGAGLENVESEDMAVPFLKIVQKSSPIIDTNPDARPGMILNSVSGEMYTNLVLVPVGFKKEIIQWAPRDSGEGIRATHDWHTPLMAETEKNEKGINEFPPGHDHAGDLMVETRSHYVLAVNKDTGEFFPAIIAMSSTQHKYSKRWVALMNTKRVVINGVQRPSPAFAFEYNATTSQEQRDSYVWHSWTITGGTQIEEEWLLREAMNFYEAIKSDSVRGVDDDEDAPF